MTLQTLINHYRPRLIEQFGKSLTPIQWSALNAMEGCRSGQYGEITWACDTCPEWQTTPRSCGHRMCNQCQHHSTQEWLERQQQKQLPVTYYMATFTLPRQLHSLCLTHPKIVYTILLSASAETLKTFARNDPSLPGELGFCSVLHTHSRRLDLHPHVHVVIPGGSVNKARRQWRTASSKYLFNGKKLANVFRAIFLRKLNESGLQIPGAPDKWVVQCKKVGGGLEALRYLSRYLYRGVISNHNIIHDDGDYVTFQYRDSKTNERKTRSLHGEKFLKLLLVHCLPKGFRRARDYGFLHSNAKQTIKVLQWLFRVPVNPSANSEKKKAGMQCKHCRRPMECVLVTYKPSAPG